MNYFGIDADGKLKMIDTDYRKIEAAGLRDIAACDLKTFGAAIELAAQVSLLTKDLHLPVDFGDQRYPRYDIVCAPKVGDYVSYGFNGDIYPDGQIIAITRSGIVHTKNHTYRRRRLTSTWTQPGGTWSLVRGTHNEQNPEF